MAYIENTIIIAMSVGLVLIWDIGLNKRFHKKMKAI